MTMLHLDFETRSRIDLKKCGLDVYARDPSTEVLMLGYALDDHPVHLWEPHREPMPSALAAMLRDPSVDIVAHNAPFERAILRHVLGFDIPAERFICTMYMAFCLALPGDLDKLTRSALRLDVSMQKNADGKRLIGVFCKPHKGTKRNPGEWNDWDTNPDDWYRFGMYCQQDVAAERKVYRILRKYFSDFDATRRFWNIDQDINQRGMPIDIPMARGAQVIAAKHKKILKAAMTDISGLANANSPAQVLPWMIDRGYPFNNLRKERVKLALEIHFAGDTPCMTDEAVEFIKLRQQAAKTSVMKYPALERCTSFDGLLRNMFQARGAGRTGRYGGRYVQVQNLPQPAQQVKPFLDNVRQMIREADHEALVALFDNPLDVLSSSIRSAIAAPPGYKFVVADLSAIELCVLAWLTNCKFWMEVLRNRLDPYKSFGVHFLGKPYEDITKQERNWCKPGALGAGYRLGGGFLEIDKNGDEKKTGLWGYAESLGVKLTQVQAKRATEVYRELSPEIVNFWYDLENACIAVITDKQPRTVRGLLIDLKAPFLRIRLPSGRHLFYCRPKVETVRVKGEDGYFNTTNMTYEGVDQYTKQWSRQSTHGGKLTENCLGEETRVLTPCGPKGIVDVQITDKVWDGSEWVKHSGVIEQGVQHTVSLGGGIRITPEHKVDVNKEWVPAGETDYAKATSSFRGHYRTPESHADGAHICGGGWKEIHMAGSLRLRSREKDASIGVSQRQGQVVRLRAGSADWGSEYNSRDEYASGLLGLAVDAGAMQQFTTQGLQKLRRTRNQGLRQMAKFFLGVLGRHGRGLCPEQGYRKEEQQLGLSQSELSLGHPQGKHSQQTQQQGDQHPERTDASLRGRGDFRDRSNDLDVSPPKRLSSEANVSEAGFYEPVFDLLNAGPHQRFTIVGDDGQLVLVHNCVQAIACDVLTHGFTEALDEGFDVRGHVHDEDITLCPLDDTEHTVERLCEVITRAPEWAEGLPLSAAGYEGDFYRKD